MHGVASPEPFQNKQSMPPIGSRSAQGLAALVSFVPTTTQPLPFLDVDIAQSLLLYRACTFISERHAFSDSGISICHVPTSPDSMKSPLPGRSHRHNFPMNDELAMPSYMQLWRLAYYGATVHCHSILQVICIRISHLDPTCITDHGGAECAQKHAPALYILLFPVKDPTTRSQGRAVCFPFTAVDFYGPTCRRFSLSVYAHYHSPYLLSLMQTLLYLIYPSQHARVAQQGQLLTQRV